MYMETITQRLALANGVVPQTLNAAAADTDGIDMLKNHRAFFAVIFGATVGGTVTLSLQESADNSTWPAAGTASPFSNSGGANVQQSLAPPVANKLYTFEVRADQLTNGKRYVRLDINASANNNLLACVAWGDEGNHKPNSANNASNVLAANQNVVS
jgi:hypothetical protein